MEDINRCQVCGLKTQQLLEAEIIGRERVVCEECHGHLKDVW